MSERVLFLGGSRDGRVRELKGFDMEYRYMPGYAQPQMHIRGINGYELDELELGTVRMWLATPALTTITQKRELWENYCTDLMEQHLEPLIAADVAWRLKENPDE